MEIKIVPEKVQVDRIQQLYSTKKPKVESEIVLAVRIEYMPKQA